VSKLVSVRFGQNGGDASAAPPAPQLAMQGALN